MDVTSFIAKRAGGMEFKRSVALGRVGVCGSRFAFGTATPEAASQYLCVAETSSLATGRDPILGCLPIKEVCFVLVSVVRVTLFCRIFWIFIGFIRSCYCARQGKGYCIWSQSALPTTSRFMVRLL